VGQTLAVDARTGATTPGDINGVGVVFKRLSVGAGAPNVRASTVISRVDVTDDMSLYVAVGAVQAAPAHP
jgi:hypothetical protein